jgi:hypothetical protein
MALMFPSTFQTPRDPRFLAGPSAERAERLAFESFHRQLGNRWWVFYDRVVMAGEDEGRIDFVLINRAIGVVLAATGAPWSDPDAAVAISAIRDALRSRGFEDRFHGHLPVVAVSVSPEAPGDLEALIEAAFASSKPLTIAEGGWADDVAEMLMLPGDLPRDLPGDLDDRHLPASACAKTSVRIYPVERRLDEETADDIAIPALPAGVQRARVTTRSFRHLPSQRGAAVLALLVLGPVILLFTALLAWSDPAQDSGAAPLAAGSRPQSGVEAGSGGRS